MFINGCDSFFFVFFLNRGLCGLQCHSLLGAITFFLLNQVMRLATSFTTGCIPFFSSSIISEAGRISRTETREGQDRVERGLCGLRHHSLPGAIPSFFFLFQSSISQARWILVQRYGELGVMRFTTSFITGCNPFFFFLFNQSLAKQGGFSSERGQNTFIKTLKGD